MEVYGRILMYLNVVKRDLKEIVEYYGLHDREYHDYELRRLVKLEVESLFKDMNLDFICDSVDITIDENMMRKIELNISKRVEGRLYGTDGG